MKRTLGIILALCLLVGMAPVSYAQEPIEINIYHHMSSDTARGQATEKILEMFNQEYEGIYKAVADVNPDFPTYQEKVKAMIAANETPDIFCYTYNPNAKWDWWQIGGRFSRNFLVKEDLEDCIISYDRSSGEPDGAPRGYKYVDDARKKDICWDLMKQLTVEEVEKGYQKCVAAFASNDPTGFGPLTKIVEDGIASWGSMIYLKGETLDEFKARKGATDMDQYMISSFAAIDRNGDWLGSGDMGWFGISTNDKEERAWNDELQTLMNEAQDDDFLVVVDCHI